MSQFEILSILLIALSPAVGSFLGVLVDRLPRGEEVIVKPSACRSCKAKLGWFELVPVLSFLVQRGRCKGCTSSIPPWVFYIEVLAIGAAVLGVIASQGHILDAVLTTIFLWMLLALAIADARWFRLPDVLNAALAASALALASLPSGIGMQAVYGALIGGMSFLILRVGYQWIRGREGLGLGDVKLMVGLGAFIGPFTLPWMLMIAACTALSVALVQQFNRAQRVDLQTPLPFGTALCAATFAIWLARMLS